jgi:subtilisin family serine protease
MKATKTLTGLALLTSLAACGGGGGGGGGVSISPPTEINFGSIANANVDMSFISQEFVSILRNISADQKADAKETLGVFEWLSANQNKVNISELAQFEITVDGEKMGLDTAWNKLIGYKKVYYDGKESFWKTVAEKGQLDDESEVYTDIKTVVDNKDLIDFEKVGKGETPIENVKETIKKKKEEIAKKKEKKKEEDKKPPKIVETGRNTVDDVTTSTSTSTQVKDPVVVTTYNDVDTSVVQDNGDTVFTKTRHYLDTTTVTTVVTTTTTTSTVKVTTVNYSDGTSKVTRGTPVVTVKAVPESTDKITTAIRQEVVDTWTVKAKVFETGRLTKDETTTTVGDPVVTDGEPTVTTTYQDKQTSVTKDNGDVVITTTRHFTDTSTVVRTTKVTTTIKTVAVTTINYSDGTETITKGEPTFSTSDAVTTEDIVTTNTRLEVIGAEIVNKSDTTVTVGDWYWLRLDVAYLDPVVLTSKTKTTQVGTTVTVTRYDTVYTPEVHTHVDARDTTTTVTYSDGTKNETITTETKNREPVTKHPTDKATEVATVINTYEVEEVVYDTEDDKYLGTKTPGYNPDPLSYKTNEYNHLLNDNLDSSNFNFAYSRGWTGKGSKVVIADTGIDTNHSEFQGQIADTIDYTGQGMSVGSDHGTHVAGITGAKKDGIGMHGAAFDSKLLVAKVASGYRYSFGNAKSAAAWGKGKGSVAINVSAELNLDRAFQNSLVKIGDGSYKSTHWYYGENGYNGVKNDALSWKDALGEQVLVKAAGNAGRDYSAGFNQMSTATDDNGNLILDGQMLIVGSWDANNDKIASSSNRAGNVCVTFKDGVCKDAKMIKDFFIMADGTQITSAKNGGGYVTMTGTSMAAPTVTGAIAVLHQMWPHMKGKNLVQLVLVTGDKQITNYNENVHGQGLLDMDKATQPVGGVGIPKTGRVDGGTSSISGGAAVNGGASGIVALSNIMVVDSFDRDFYVDLTQMVQPTDTRTLSATEAMGSDINYYAGYMNSDQHIALPMQLNEYSRITVGTGQSTGHYLGNNTEGTLGTTKSSTTTYANLDAKANFGEYKVYGQIGLGVTRVNYDTTNSIMVDNDLAYSSTWTVGGEKTVYQVDDVKHTLGFNVSQPVTVESAKATYNVATGVTVNGDLINTNKDVDFGNDKREIDVGAYYKYQKDNTELNVFGEIRNNVAALSNGISKNIGVNIKWSF